MENGILLEVFFVIVVLAFAIRELVILKRLKREREERNRRNAGAPAPDGG